MVENITLYPVTAHLWREFIFFVEGTSIVAQLLVCWGAKLIGAGKNPKVKTEIASYTIINERYPRKRHKVF